MALVATLLARAQNSSRSWGRALASNQLTPRFAFESTQPQFQLGGAWITSSIPDPAQPGQLKAKRARSQEALDRAAARKAERGAQKAALAKPRRAINPWILYVQEHMPPLCQAQPGLSASTLIKELASDWKRLTPSEKQPYTEAADRARAELPAPAPKSDLKRSKYTTYVSKKLPQLKQQHPEWTAQECMTAVAEAWHREKEHLAA